MHGAAVGAPVVLVVLVLFLPIRALSHEVTRGATRSPRCWHGMSDGVHSPFAD